MKKYNVTNEIAKYIADNKISIDDITKETGIPKNKMINGGKKLTAVELLKICFYLNVRPEQLAPKLKNTTLYRE